MGITMEILKGLWDIKLRYKGVPTRAFFITDFSSADKNSYRSTLSRLKKDGLIKYESQKWFITNFGKKYLIEHKRYLKSFDSPFEKSAPKNLLVMFDVPNSKETERKWFRMHLKRFGYTMLQKSVWIGPSPLPKKFLEYLKEIKFTDCVKTFKFTKPYQIKK